MFQIKAFWTAQTSYLDIKIYLKDCISPSNFVNAANKKQDTVMAVLCDQLPSDTGCPILKCILSIFKIVDLIQFTLIWSNPFRFIKAAKNKQNVEMTLCDQLVSDTGCSIKNVVFELAKH